jgi:hypothetical protein
LRKELLVFLAPALVSLGGCEFIAGVRDITETDGTVDTENEDSGSGDDAVDANVGADSPSGTLNDGSMLDVVTSGMVTSDTVPSSDGAANARGADAASEGTTADSASSSSSDSGGADAVARSDSASSSSDSSAPPPPPPTNLITNGNFVQGTTDWAIVSGTATVSIVAGDLCVAVAAANDTTMIVLGWPEPSGSVGVPLSATGSYTFSYTAHATKADVTINATVGDSVGPDYLPVDFESKTDPVTTTASTFIHPFTPASGADTSAGLSFLFVSNVAQSVCFANVSLVEN